MLKKTIIPAALIIGMSISASAAQIEITPKGLVIDGAEHTMSDAPFEQAGAAYVPLDEALPLFGYSLGWDSTLGGTICEKEGSPDAIIFPRGSAHIIGYNMYSYNAPTLNIDGKCYIHGDLLADLADADVSVSEDLGVAAGIIIPDTYRYAPSLTDVYTTCITLDRHYMFEPVKISSQNASYYAGIVNDIAAKLPADVNVYNMLVPDSGEFYAPKEYYCAQTAAFEEVYSKLSDRVTPVRVAQALYDHAGEAIYFRTDHHWTQRGAYYAWKLFMEMKGDTVPELSEFEKSDSWQFTGSFALHLAEGTPADALNETTELLERFSPKYDTTAVVYDSIELENGIEIKTVNTEVDDYSCFICGDNPITAIKGGNPNGKKIAIIKESVGNVLATWAVNNYEEVYVLDMRKFYDTGFNIALFQSKTGFNDLLIESYPTTVESSDLRIGLLSFTK